MEHKKRDGFTYSRHRHKEDEKHPTRYYSKKQEEIVAKSTGGKRQPNSGATAFAKGDVISGKWLIECKTKTKSSDSISIKKEWFNKNTDETLLTGSEYSTICFNFGPDEENYYIIDEELFMYLKEKIEREGIDL